jgi:hypothetical protein
MSFFKKSDVKNHLSTRDRNGKPILRLHKQPSELGSLPVDSAIASPDHATAETPRQPTSAQPLAAPTDGIG